MEITEADIAAIRAAVNSQRWRRLTRPGRHQPDELVSEVWLRLRALPGAVPAAPAIERALRSIYHRTLRQEARLRPCDPATIDRYRS